MEKHHMSVASHNHVPYAFYAHHRSPKEDDAVAEADNTLNRRG